MIESKRLIPPKTIEYLGLQFLCGRRSNQSQTESSRNLLRFFVRVIPRLDSGNEVLKTSKIGVRFPIGRYPQIAWHVYALGTSSKSSKIYKWISLTHHDTLGRACYCKGGRIVIEPQ